MTNPIAIATGRDRSLFEDDVLQNSEVIRRAFSGKRALVIGGAGTIGAATLRALLPYGPSAVHVIDHNENGLAELIRDLHGSGLIRKNLDFKLMPLDYGALVTRRFLSSVRPYDIVLHFAALKHVRSEKAVSAILQMIDTNVLKQQRLISWLNQDGLSSRYFAVSTDKAANPANFMGASKRLMERLIFCSALTPLTGVTRTSARFANVAFSAGSLLASFPERVQRRQPLVVPRQTRRFFVSVGEAAQICLLASAAIPDHHIAIPRMRADKDLRELEPIAEAFLRSIGLTPERYDSEALARNAVENDAQRGHWPLLLTERDTDGEKESEVFLGDGERAKETGLAALLAVPQPDSEPAKLQQLLSDLNRIVHSGSPPIAKGELAAMISTVVPEFKHLERGRSLDERM